MCLYIVESLSIWTKKFKNVCCWFAKCKRDTSKSIKQRIETVFLTAKMRDPKGLKIIVHLSLAEGKTRNFVINSLLNENIWVTLDYDRIRSHEK